MKLPTPGEWLRVQEQAAGKNGARLKFRNDTFERDGYQCRMCGHKPDTNQWLDWPLPCDAHHIVDRHLMPFGGYVKANGITVCPKCHEYAEYFHATGTAHPGYAPADLFKAIGSSYDAAFKDALSLGYQADDVAEWIICLEQIGRKELELAAFFGEPPDSNTWDLSCVELDVDEPTMLLYGKGRC